MVDEIIIALIVAVVTSFLTVHLSLRSFHRQKLWEKKEEAYSELISALYDLQVFCARLSYQISKENRKLNLIEVGEYRQLLMTLSRYEHAGSLVISQEAIGCLESFFRNYMEAGRHGDEESYTIDRARQVKDASEQCSDAIIPIARKDLETTGSLFGDVFGRIRRWTKALPRKPQEPTSP